MSSIQNSASDIGSNVHLGGLASQFDTTERPPLAALAEINQRLKTASVGLQFEFDDKSGQIVARVVNVETGKLIRQMPSEELMQLSKVLGKLHEMLVHQAICRKAQLTERSQVSAPMRWSNSMGSLGVPGR